MLRLLHSGGNQVKSSLLLLILSFSLFYFVLEQQPTYFLQGCSMCADACLDFMANFV
jgi:hypothetical protein